jgi:hypothetical protein
MPEIKNYEGKKKQSGKGHEETEKEKSHSKRRPHKEMAEETHSEEVQTSFEMAEENDSINTEAQNEGVSAEEAAPHSHVHEDESHTHAHEQDEKLHLEFFGSELIRQKAPKIMDVADSVADEWVKDGQFQSIPVGHPLAQYAASKVLRKAKDVEKKLDEKGVFVMARMGLDYVKSEINKRKKF